MPLHPRIPGRRLTHSPGPTPLPDAVQHALMTQPMDLGDPRVAANVAACEAGLKRLLEADADTAVFFYSANGHGAWEVTIENLLPPGGLVLVPGTGHFAQGWIEQTEVLGRRTVTTPWRQGLPIDPADVERVLREDRAHEIVAVFFVHTDTASSVTSDAQAMRRAIDAAGHPALLVLDGVASVGAMRIPMAEWGVDVVVGASQKGLMLPPGLGWVAVNAKAGAVARANPAPRYYWDWERRRGPHNYQKFCGTVPQNLMFALEASLGLIEAEGAAAVFARHRWLAGAVQAAVGGWSEAGALGFFAREPATRSVSVTTITTPPDLVMEDLRTLARERFQVAVAGGLGPLTNKAFRIGHLGDQNPALVLGAIGGVEAALTQMGVPHGPGLRRAVEFLARPAD